jgi:hypothetical protein
VFRIGVTVLASTKGDFVLGGRLRMLILQAEEQKVGRETPDTCSYDVRGDKTIDGTSG